MSKYWFRHRRLSAGYPVYTPLLESKPFKDLIRCSQWLVQTRSQHQSCAWFPSMLVWGLTPSPPRLRQTLCSASSLRRCPSICARPETSSWSTGVRRPVRSWRRWPVLRRSGWGWRAPHTPRPSGSSQTGSSPERRAPAHGSPSERTCRGFGFTCVFIKTRPSSELTRHWCSCWVDCCTDLL